MRAFQLVAITVLSTIFGILATPPVSAILALTGADSGILAFVVLNTPHILMLVFALFSCRLVMGWKPGMILRDDGRADWKVLASGVLSALCVLVAGMLLTEGVQPVSAPAARRLAFLCAALVLTPLQALSEEVVFRVLPVRAVTGGSLDCPPWRQIAASLVSGLLFLALHLSNSEFSLGLNKVLVALYYFLFGVLGTLTSFRKGGFEAVWGVHLANNLFIALVLNYPGSPYVTPSLFTRGTPLSMPVQLVQLVLIFTLVTFIPHPGFKKEIKESDYGQREI